MLSISLDTMLGVCHFIYLTFCCTVLRNIKTLRWYNLDQKAKIQTPVSMSEATLIYDTLSQVQHLQRRDLFERTLRGV